jgi:hypothetical protein
VQRNGNEIKKSVTFLPYWTFWLDMEKKLQHLELYNKMQNKKYHTAGTTSNSKNCIL